MKKLLCFFLLLTSLHVQAQLGGFGIAPFGGPSGEGKRFSGKTLNEDFHYGVWAYKEGYGFMMNAQIGLGYLHQSYQFADTSGNTVSLGRDYIQIVPSFKYWFGNAMRAGSIVGLKCAHKTKIIYNYNFKPYLIFGLPYNFLLNKKSIENSNPNEYRKSGFSFLGGIGANLIEIGGNIDPTVIFLEFRMIQDLKPFLKNESFSNLYGFGFQAVLGLKFERD